MKMFTKFNPIYNKITFLIILCIALIPVIGFILIRWLGGHIEQSAQLGDTVGGLMGPFIAICASFLTFIAFLVQFEANQQQKDDLEIERFESKFFELLNLHKQNVSEMKLEDGKSGREVFVSLFYELKLANGLINEIAKRKEGLNVGYKNNLSYKIFFYGIGSNSEKQYEIQDLENKVLEQIKDGIRKFNEFDHTQLPESRFLIKVYELLDNYRSNVKARALFDGHVSLLSHYYRHLFQTVRYVVEQMPKSIKGTEREDKTKEYLRILRAQLSNHEQILLYYNGSSIANAWFEKGYFTKYRMIHNLPIPLADFGLKPNEHPEIIKWRKDNSNDDLFEWDG